LRSWIVRNGTVALRQSDNLVLFVTVIRGVERCSRRLWDIFWWETIYITSNLQEFATIRGRLLDSGIRTKTKTGGSGAMGEE
jgi:hypothetical protein